MKGHKCIYSRVKLAKGRKEKKKRLPKRVPIKKTEKRENLGKKWK
jgi:hypothetical protein